MTTRHLTAPDGTRLAYRDELPPDQAGPAPGAGRPILLLHGLAGTVGEWDHLTARLLAAGRRVVRYDARGHGESTLRPQDVSRAAAVQDAVTLIDHLSLAPVTLIGQSLGGHTAMLLAASHPHLVSSLVLVEAGPGGPKPDTPAQIAKWLDDWNPGFDFDRATMIESVREPATNSYWTQWSQITCPTLLIRGTDGFIPDDEAATMLTSRPDTRSTVVPDAGHDVHLDQPDRLYEAVAAFLGTP